MEHDDRHLDCLSSSMNKYFNEVLIHKNCVSFTFRKNIVKNDEDDFSFLLLRSTCNEKKPLCPTDSSCVTEEEGENLIQLSQCWQLHLAEVSFKGSKVCLKLNRPHAFCTIIKSILSRESDYGKCFFEKQKIRVTSDESDLSDLTFFRLKLIKIAAENLLIAGGYKLWCENEDLWVHFTTKNSIREEESEAKVKVLCGPVVNSETKTKETRITPEEYRKLLLSDLELKSENKTSSKELLDSLVDASVIVSILRVKSSQAVSLNFFPGCAGRRETGSKGGAFLQYNASRLAAIRTKHGRLVLEGVYPETPGPEEVDFGSLKEQEEWALLFNFLLEYPSLIRKTSEEMAAGISNIHQICDFLLKFCSLFSVYYRRVRILLEPKDHLLQIIHARLLLAKAVEQVLENGLTILNLNKIEQM